MVTTIAHSTHGHSARCAAAVRPVALTARSFAGSSDAIDATAAFGPVMPIQGQPTVEQESRQSWLNGYYKRNLLPTGADAT